MENEGVRALLFVRFSSLGDIVLTLPALDLARRNFPMARIYFLTFERYAGVFQGNPNIDGVLTIKGVKGREGIRELLRIKEKARDMGIDLFADLHHNLRTFFLRRMVKGDWLRYRKGIVRRRLMVWFKTGIERGCTPVYQAYADALQGAGIREEVAPPSLAYLPRTRGGGEIRLGVAPAARWATKMWPCEYYQELLERIEREYPVRITLFGDRREEGLLLALGGKMKRQPEILCEPPLPILIERIGEMDLFISGDTGPMHIASAWKVPQIALFGPTVREFGFAPPSPPASILEVPLPCRPCSLHGSKSCPLGHFQCMRGISVQRVYEEFCRMAGGPVGIRDRHPENRH